MSNSTIDKDWWNVFGEQAYREHLGRFSKERTLQEVDFILTKTGITPGSRVLDMPCGLGRHSNELAARGMNVIGVDIAPLSIEEAVRSSSGMDNVPSYYVGDIRALPVSIKDCDAVLNLYSSYGYFGKGADQMVLTEANRVLNNDGLFVIDVLSLESQEELFNLQGEPDEQDPELKTIHKEIQKDEVWYTLDRWFDQASGVIRTITTWEGPDAEVKSYETHIQLYRREEIIQDLEQAGFEIEETWGDYDGSDHGAEGTSRTIIMARKHKEVAEREGVPDIIADQNEATRRYLSQREGQIPSYDRTQLTDDGLYLGTRERPIDILAVPRIISPEQQHSLEQGAIVLNDVISRATAYVLADPVKRNMVLDLLPEAERIILEESLLNNLEDGDYQGLLDKINARPYVARVDRLLGGPQTIQNQGAIPIEINTNCPEGFLYLDAAQRAYQRSLGIAPSLFASSFLHRSLSSMVETVNRPTVAMLTYPDSVVSTVELPHLTEVLNNAQSEIDYVYGTTDQLEVSNGIATVNGKSVDAMWRNWGTVIPGRTDLTVALSQSETPMLNPAYSFIRGIKMMFAVISTDEDFRSRHMSSEEKLVIDNMLPATYLVTSGADIGRYGLNNGEYIFKPVYGSSGNGVTSDTNEAIASIDSGVPYVAQRLVVPEYPSILSAFPGDSSSAAVRLVRTYGDMNQYIAHLPGQSDKADLIVARAKAKHPINVAQGGALTGVFTLN